MRRNKEERDRRIRKHFPILIWQRCSRCKDQVIREWMTAIDNRGDKITNTRYYCKDCVPDYNSALAVAYPPKPKCKPAPQNPHPQTLKVIK